MLHFHLIALLSLEWLGLFLAFGGLRYRILPVIHWYLLRWSLLFNGFLPGLYEQVVVFLSNLFYPLVQPQGKLILRGILIRRWQFFRVHNFLGTFRWVQWRFCFLLLRWWGLPDINLGLLQFIVIILLGLACKIVQPCEVEIEGLAEAKLIWMVRHSLWVVPPTSVLGSLVTIVPTSIGGPIVVCPSVDRVRLIFFELDQFNVIPMPTKP
jgi:hypothetical protein